MDENKKKLSTWVVCLPKFSEFSEEKYDEKIYMRDFFFVKVHRTVFLFRTWCGDVNVNEY